MPRRKEVDVAEIVRLYVEQGRRIQAIAADLGLTYGLVRSRLREAGVTLQRAGRPIADHGSVTAYVRRGCRCGPCKVAGDAVNARQRAARAAARFG